MLLLYLWLTSSHVVGHGKNSKQRDIYLALIEPATYCTPALMSVIGMQWTYIRIYLGVRNCDETSKHIADPIPGATYTIAKVRAG